MLSNFPREYSSFEYIQKNPDLSEEELELHWNSHGWKEDRLGQFVLTRSHLKGILDRHIKYLEIGPYGRPFLTRDMFNVKYFDVLSQDDLKTKSRSDSDHDEKNIPLIDYIDPFGDLSIINEKFDSVFSSHCIEHQPSILSHLKGVSNLLNDGGIYICIIPNYRYCFDRHKPPSTIIDVIEAYLWADKNHSHKNILLHRYYSAHNNPILHWEGNSNRVSVENVNVNEVIEFLTSPQDGYIDCHAWFFDENIFSSIFKNPDIAQLIGLNLGRCYQTPINSHEFIAIFQKST